MTVTETPPEAATDPSEAPGPAGDRPAQASGLAAVVGTGDHKVIGRLYIGFSLLFGLAALVGALVTGIDRIDGLLGNDIVDSSSWYQVTTFASTSMVFLFLVPLLLGIAFVVVPLQVGATAIAFPRAAAASFWGWLMGAGSFIAAYAMNGGPGGGRADGVGLWAASFGMLVAALLLGAVCVVTTVFAYRADGMALSDAPLFSWSMLIAGVMWVLTLPVLLATLVLIYVDHRYGQQSFGFNGPEMFTRVSWALRQPQIYTFAVPVLGIVGDVIPVAAGRRQPQRSIVMGAIGLFGVLGFGAFLQGTIYPGATVQPVYVAMAVLAVFPVLALLGGWASAVKSGKPRLISPLVFGVFTVLSLLLATLAGATASIERFDLQGTLFEVAQSNLTILAAITGAIGALFYWSSKITGRSLPSGLGMLTALALFGGTLAVAVPSAVSGAFADGDDVRRGLEGLNVVTVAGYGLVLAGVLLAILALVGSLRGPNAEDDPWEGQTLEWTTSSPPSATNFAGSQTVRSAEPLLDSAPEEASV